MIRNPLSHGGAADDTEEQANGGSRRVGRRALLTGGAVMASAVGAGAALAVTATPASAATGDPVLLGDVNSAGAGATEIDATSSGTPTLILTNAGSPAATQASAALRLTPAATGLNVPATASAGGDLVATNDGNLWFTHNNPAGSPIPATVHTDATSNSFVPLTAPYRILDTRSSALRAHILDASGNLDSQGRLLAGHTIHIDLSHLVYYGDAVTANLTIIGPVSGGWALVWPGSGTRPTSSSIAFAKGQAISNLTVCGINHAFSSSKTDTIAVTSAETTQVILDVAGFYVGNFGQVNSAYSPFGASTSSAANATKAAVAHASQARAMLHS